MLNRLHMGLLLVSLFAWVGCGFADTTPRGSTDQGPSGSIGTVAGVSIVLPVANATLDALSINSISAWGMCANDGGNVIITGDANAVVACTQQVWATGLDFSAAATGSVAIMVQQGSTQTTRQFYKATGAAAVTFLSPANGSYINRITSTAFTMQGVCSGSAPVYLGGAMNVTAACSGGVWSATLDVSSLSDGPIVFDAVQTDASGHTTPPASAYFFLDRALPVVTLNPPLAYINASEQNSVVFSGTCSAVGQPVTLSGALSHSTFCLNTNWSMTLSLSAVADGNLAFQVGHADAAGNAAQPIDFNITKITVAPSVAFTSPAPGSNVLAGDVAHYALAGPCSANNQNVVLSAATLALGQAACSSGNWTANVDLSALADGPLTINADLTDVAGNRASTATLHVSKHTLALSVAIVSPASGATISSLNANDFTLVGTCSYTSQPVVISGALNANAPCNPDGTWSVTLDFSQLADGTLNLSVDLSDGLGNSAPTFNTTYVKHALPPSVAFTTPAPGSWVNASDYSSFTLGGTCSASGSTVYLTGQGSGSATCISGAWSANVNYAGAGQGPVTVYANFQDSYGNNANAVAYTLTLDTIAPGLTIVAPAANAYVNLANQNAVVFSGSCTEPNQPVVLSGNASASVLCQNSNWTVTVDLTGDSDGPLQVAATHDDLAGNSTTQYVSLTKDTSVPTAPSVVINNGEVATSGTVVTLALHANNSPTSMDISEAPGCADSNWVAYRSTYPWPLTNLGLDSNQPTSALNTIYVKFQNAAGNVSACVSASIYQEAMTVSPVYPANGAQWNNYVQVGNLSLGSYHQVDTSCWGDNTGAMDQNCVHGGVLKAVQVGDRASCAGLTLAEALGAFNWICRDTNSTPAEVSATFYSTGFNPNFGLANLLDANAWLDNSVTVSLNGNFLHSTVSQAWWSNPVLPLPQNGSLGAAVATLEGGTIYTVNSNIVTQGYTSDSNNRDGVAVVGLGPYTLQYGGNGTYNCGSERCMFFLGPAHYLWFENLTMSGQATYHADVGLNVQATYSVFKDLTFNDFIARNTAIFYVHSGFGYRLNNITAVNNSPGNAAIFIEGDFLSADTLTASNASGVCIIFVYADNSNVTNLFASNCPRESIDLQYAYYTTFSNLVVSSSGNGVNMYSGPGQTIRNVTASNIRGTAVNFWGDAMNVRTSNSGQGVAGTGNVVDWVSINDGTPYTGSGKVVQATIINAGGTAMQPQASSSTFHNILIANSAGDGILASTDETTYSQIVSANNAAAGVHGLSQTQEASYIGALLTGSNSGTACQVDPGTNNSPGIADANCTTTGQPGSNTYPGGLSSAVYWPGIDLSGSLVGLVTSDSNNQSQVNGVEAYSNITDWLNFDNNFRGWGQDGNAFAAPNDRGRCGSGQCAIWDARLRSTDTVLLDRSGNGNTLNDPFVPGGPCPSQTNGNLVGANVTGQVFLLTAVELPFSPGGNNDGLCESGETCLYTPNFGAYQGEGGLIGPCTFNANGGPVTGVTLYAYAINGAP